MPRQTPDVEQRRWVHPDLLGFYEGVYYWEYVCQNCGTTWTAMPWFHGGGGSVPPGPGRKK
jgi:hypothetical protein